MAQIAIDPDDTWQDPDSVVGIRVSAPYRTLLAGLTAYRLDAVHRLLDASP